MLPNFARLPAAGALAAAVLLAAPCGYGQSPVPSATTAAAPADAPVDPLHTYVDEAIASTTRRYLDVNVHTPWQLMHGILALRGEYLVKRDGEKINALEWVAGGPSFEGQPWFQKTEHGGQAHPYTRDYAFEGHPNQFLAILTMSQLPGDFTVQSDQGPITIADMVRHAQQEINTEEELTWTLWALSQYLPPDATWQNKHGQQWSMEGLVRLQARAEVEKAACGGTHALFALSFTLDKYSKTGRPLAGAWFEADQTVRRYVETARWYQNSDGSLSSNYFTGGGYSGDFKKRLETTGHILEFLMMGLPGERLNEEWVRRAVYALAKDLLDNRREPADVGALYHALDGLVIYRERTRPKPPVEIVAGVEEDEGTKDDDAQSAPTEKPAEPAQEPSTADEQSAGDAP